LAEFFKFYDMSNFTFITEKYSENPQTVYFAIDSEKIETLNVSDTYDQNGQQVTAEQAGDYILIANEEDAEKLNKWCTEHTADLDDEEGTIYGWNEGEIINNDDFRFGMFKEVVSEKSIIKTTCKGFTYWNGHNWRTITTEQEHYEPSHTIVTDSELIEKLKKAIENKEFEKKGFGFTAYRFEDVEIIESNWQGVFAEYKITID
jgi:hypothetical protein